MRLLGSPSSKSSRGGDIKERPNLKELAEKAGPGGFSSTEMEEEEPLFKNKLSKKKDD